MKVEVLEIMDCDKDSTSILVTEFMEILASGLASIPEGLRAGALVRLSAYGDYARGTLELERDETEEEKSERKAEDDARWRQYADREAASERATYLRLKSKFEGS